MTGIVIVSYAVAGLINLFYGRYHDLNHMQWFTRAMVYPVTAIILELPNILVMYWIHYDTYKPLVLSDLAGDKKRAEQVDNRTSYSHTELISNSDEESEVRYYKKEIGFIQLYEQGTFQKEFENQTRTKSK